MFGLMSVAMLVFFLAMLILVGLGFVRHARTTNKIFQLANREVDRRLAETGTPAEVDCDHCGSRVPTGPSCPNCGASLSG